MEEKIFSFKELIILFKQLSKQDNYKIEKTINNKNYVINKENNKLTITCDDNRSLELSIDERCTLMNRDYHDYGLHGNISYKVFDNDLVLKTSLNHYRIDSYLDDEDLWGINKHESAKKRSINNIDKITLIESIYKNYTFESSIFSDRVNVLINNGEECLSDTYNGYMYQIGMYNSNCERIYLNKQLQFNSIVDNGVDITDEIDVNYNEYDINKINNIISNNNFHIITKNELKNALKVLQDKLDIVNKINLRAIPNSRYILQIKDKINDNIYEYIFNKDELSMIISLLDSKETKKISDEEIVSLERKLIKNDKF